MKLLEKYEKIVGSGLIKIDQKQIQIVKRLQALTDAITETKRTSSLNVWDRLFRRPSRTTPTTFDKRGMYLYGGVGSGKTMLMDLFFSHCPETFKLRTHYSSFMLDVHSRLHQLKVERVSDPVSVVAKGISQEVRLLCLDEFQVVDVADAMLLRNLIGNLIDRGMYFLITSNRHPKELYLNGIQRNSFIPCIELLERRLEVINLTGDQDYRRKEDDHAARYKGQIFFSPVNNETDTRIEEIITELTKGKPRTYLIVDDGDDDDVVVPRTIFTHGRPINIKKSCDQVAVMTFDELCNQPLSAADYLCIATHFPFIVLLNVPRMTFQNRDEARRFITLVDILYDQKVKLVLQSTVPPLELFQLGERLDERADLRFLADELALPNKTLKESSLASGAEEMFAVHRATSRLTEMSHHSWWPLEYHSIFATTT